MPSSHSSTTCRDVIAFLMTSLTLMSWTHLAVALPLEDKVNLTQLFDADQLNEMTHEVQSILHLLQKEAILQKEEEDQVDKTNSTQQEDDDSTILFEGDIMLTPGEAETMLQRSRSRKKRKITAKPEHIWPLPIPYRFNEKPKYYLNASEKAAVRNAMKEISELTCVTFKEVDSSYSKKPILDFRNDYGCWSYVGRETSFKYQEISTAKGCFKKGVLLHELGHALGFWHEQSRPDRDGHVTYLEKNVKRGEEFNFKRETWGDIKNMGVPYDVGSIMHYGSRFFSKNGKDPTLQSNDPLLQRDLGQRRAMSFYDVKLANLVYCQDSCPKANLTCLHNGYPDPKDCSRCRCPDGLSGSRCQNAAPNTGSRCGGPLKVENGIRYTIRSPSYPWAYAPNTKCTWLFKAPPGMNLYREKKTSRFMDHPNCPRSNLTVCQDYLEVKYNLSFGHTGARFCCGQAPSDVIVSRGNTMLVLFRTFRRGTGGFMADVYTEPCGGCYPTAEFQKPCYVPHKYPCRQTWYKMEYVACPVYYQPPTYVCNQWLRKKHSRESTCEDELAQCCPGYTLQKGYCVPPGHKGEITGHGGASLPPQMTTAQSITKAAQQTEQPSTGWTNWTPWSTCSKTCGGCGRRSRSRRCQTRGDCRDESASHQSQVCNTQPCPHFQAYACPHTVKERYNCGWLKYCTRTRTEMHQCVTRCCPNYEDKSSVCQPANRKRKK